MAEHDANCQVLRSGKEKEKRLSPDIDAASQELNRYSVSGGSSTMPNRGRSVSVSPTDAQYQEGATPAPDAPFVVTPWRRPVVTRIPLRTTPNSSGTSSDGSSLPSPV